jgi:hypothetical protein
MVFFINIKFIFYFLINLIIHMILKKNKKKNLIIIRKIKFFNIYYSIFSCSNQDFKHKHARAVLGSILLRV